MIDYEYFVPLKTFSWNGIYKFDVIPKDWTVYSS